MRRSNYLHVILMLACKIMYRWNSGLLILCSWNIGVSLHGCSSHIKDRAKVRYAWIIKMSLLLFMKMRTAEMLNSSYQPYKYARPAICIWPTFLHERATVSSCVVNVIHMHSTSSTQTWMAWAHNIQQWHQCSSVTTVQHRPCSMMIIPFNVATQVLFSFHINPDSPGQDNGHWT